QEIRNSATEHAINLLRKQIAERHTYFIDVEAMAQTPFAVLAKDVIEARKRELETLEAGASRLDVLGTYYGYTILLADGAQPSDDNGGYRYWRRRTWLDEKINESAADAIRKITGEFAEAVDMDRTYQTIGHSKVFKNRCSPDTASLLANTVRVSLYKVPGNRARAARELGRTGDSRALPFLHNRFMAEQNRGTRTAIAEALGKIGHESSTDILAEYIMSAGRRQTKDILTAVDSLGCIDAVEAQKALIDLLEKGSNTVKGKCIESLGRLETPGLVNIVTPYLEHRSRPVLRAAVKVLSESDDEGADVVRNNVTKILRRIGKDRVSYPALRKMFTIHGMSQKHEIHAYFAARIERLTKQVKRWQEGQNRYYSYWYRRRERRTRRELEDVLRMAAQHTSPPFAKELISSIRDMRRSLSDHSTMLQPLGRSRLAEAVA
ncbi:HEAT repeat domain-containing protein, partial [Candidatus Thorarchaeota archaeon]